MPTNKNAFIRYKYLDRLLSDRHHYYDINDLTEKVNDMMARDDLGMSVVRRTIEKDLLAMQLAPFSAPIGFEKKNGKKTDEEFLMILGNDTLHAMDAVIDYNKEVIRFNNDLSCK